MFRNRFTATTCKLLKSEKTKKRKRLKYKRTRTRLINSQTITETKPQSK